MRVRLIEAHPLVEETRNQVAVQRGPIVYCLESHDLPEDVDIAEIALAGNVKFHSQFRPDLVGGVTALTGQGLRLPVDDWDKGLYREVSSQAPVPVNISLIPYYAWGNRGDCEMTVWMPLR